MTLKEALEECKPSDRGDRVAVSFPEGVWLCFQRRGGKQNCVINTIIRAGDSDSRGGTLPNGRWPEMEDLDIAEGLQWRPAVPFAEGEG
jgi:hypothetical protein